MPGFLLALSGLILFAFCETDENYWYIHSLWHILIASSILFFLPHKGFPKQGKTNTVQQIDRFHSTINRIEKTRKSSETDLPLVIRNKSGYFVLLPSLKHVLCMNTEMD